MRPPCPYFFLLDNAIIIKGMTTKEATATAHPNIAFIKYWGNRNNNLRIALNDSISMNLAALQTRTTVQFETEEETLSSDSLILNGSEVTGEGLARVSLFLDYVRRAADVNYRARVISENNFPTGAGIASSAAAFAALALAASAALELGYNEQQLSRLARRGSGSACRSVPAGFVQWQAGESDSDSYAVSIAPPQHWGLVDCVAVVKNVHKSVGSTAGHALAGTSVLQRARVTDAPRRMTLCKSALLTRDFSGLAEVVEQDSNLMHAVMQTSNPPLFYYEPQSILLMRLVREWRAQGLPVCYTLDAGPNVHVITLQEEAETVRRRLLEVDGVSDVLVSGAGSGAVLQGA